MSGASSKEEDIRVKVSVHLEPQLRLYRRLWLAKIDLEDAKAAIDEILRARIPIPRRDRAPSLLLALTTAFVVAYARPWVYSRGQSIAERTVPGSVLRSLTAYERSLHDYLVDLRNQEIAHSDADIMDLHLKLLNGGDSALFKSRRDPFTRTDLKRILKIIEKLSSALESRCSELRKVLPIDVWI